MNPLLSQLLGTSCTQVILLPKIPLPKKLLEKIARFSTQKIDPATGVRNIKIERHPVRTTGMARLLVE